MKSTFVTIFLMLMLLEACLSITSEKIAKIEERRRHELGRRRNTQVQSSKSDRVLITFDGTDEEAKQFGEDRGWTWNRKVNTRRYLSPAWREHVKYAYKWGIATFRNTRQLTCILGNLHHF